MSTSGLTKLAITPYTDNQNPSDLDTGKRFEVLINPSTFSMNTGLSYTQEERSGQPPENKFSKFENETIQFKIILDATGVITDDNNEVIDINQKILDFRTTAYDVESEKHEPNILLMSWGNAFSVDCRLQKLTVNYKLFGSDATPLRAELDVAFLIDKRNSLDKQASPDLSHYRVVKAGDTLPLMCEHIYGDAGMHLEVARANGMVNIRQLKPGQKLLFPPIK